MRSSRRRRRLVALSAAPRGPVMCFALQMSHSRHSLAHSCRSAPSSSFTCQPTPLWLSDAAVGIARCINATASYGGQQSNITSPSMRASRNAIGSAASLQVCHSARSNCTGSRQHIRSSGKTVFCKWHLRAEAVSQCTSDTAKSPNSCLATCSWMSSDSSAHTIHKAMASKLYRAMTVLILLANQPGWQQGAG